VVRSAAFGIAATLMLLTAPAASAATAANVRFVNALPGGKPASLEVAPAGATPGAGEEVQAGFADSTDYVEVEPGSVVLTLSSGEAAQPLARVERTLARSGRYTVVAATSGASGLRVLRDGPPAGGVARLRIVHAASELGQVDVMLGRRLTARALSFEDSSPYRRVEPGTYRLSATRPGGRGGALVSRSVVLTAGTSFTVVLAGTGGQPTRIVLASDATVVPKGAPATGLGGIARERTVPWLLVLAAALAGGLLGGMGYRLASGRRSG
jgi:hypothetical protein